MNVFTLQSKSETNFVTKCIFKIKVWLWNRWSIKWKKTVNDRFSELKKREREREVVSSLSEMVDGKPKVLLEIAPFTWTLFLLCWQNPSDLEKKNPRESWPVHTMNIFARPHHPLQHGSALVSTSAEVCCWYWPARQSPGPCEVNRWRTLPHPSARHFGALFFYYTI